MACSASADSGEVLKVAPPNGTVIDSRAPQESVTATSETSVTTPTHRTETPPSDKYPAKRTGGSLVHHLLSKDDASSNETIIYFYMLEEFGKDVADYHAKIWDWQVDFDVLRVYGLSV